jgi:hypothetical protein
MEDSGSSSFTSMTSSSFFTPLALSVSTQSRLTSNMAIWCTIFKSFDVTFGFGLNNLTRNSICKEESTCYHRRAPCVPNLMLIPDFPNTIFICLCVAININILEVLPPTHKKFHTLHHLTANCLVAHPLPARPTPTFSQHWPRVQFLPSFSMCFSLFFYCFSYKLQKSVLGGIFCLSGWCKLRV